MAGKYEGPSFSRLWTKVHEISGTVEETSQFPTPYSDCHSLFPSHIFATKFRSRKTTKSIVFSPSQLFGKDDPKLLRQFVRAIYPVPFGEVWMNFVR